ncbi:hypothetical protein AC249_AIPGENE2744 [Exaiptasia diaphana]|nr:hypothetical protein AC249_AIPGENE2744 [Exaiptasia diaphana]
MEGPGRLLGYRAMQLKIREVHNLNVPRDVVYAAMGEVNPAGLEARGGVGQPKRPKRTNAFVTGGPNCCMSLDGHDKLCGYQNWMFPLAIYGGLDTYSGRVNFLKVWTTNSSPKIIGRFYLEYLEECRVLPQTLRIDRGTETDIMAAIHCFLREPQGDLEDVTESVLYGPSTQNKIERWWKELLERMERYFKVQLNALLENGDYDPTDEKDRNLLAYVYLPVVQKELDLFRECIWNNHRTRKQKGKELPAGVPEHIYQFPEKYGGEECGIPVTEEQLLEVADQSDVFEGSDDYLTPEIRHECELHLPNIDDIEPADAKDAYLFLKSSVDKALFSN